MRVPIVLLALAATPLLAAAAQQQAAAAQDAGRCLIADANRAATAAANVQRTDPWARVRTGCSPVLQQPAPSGATISGKVFRDDGSNQGLSGWVVLLNGPVSLTTLTDANGYYSFANLPSDNTHTYTVCETLQNGWAQTSPPYGYACSQTSLGYYFDLDPGIAVSMLDFGNVPQQP